MLGAQDESNDGGGLTEPVLSVSSIMVSPGAPTETPPPTDVVAEEKAGPPQDQKSEDEKEHLHRQYITHTTNQLRIKKLEINECENLLAELLRQLTHMEGELHHITQDIRRVESELHQRELVANKQEGASKSAQYDMREKDQALHTRSEKTAILDREIARIKQEIVEKEHRSATIKEESRGLTKQKEDLRRKIELEQSAGKSKVAQAHEKQVVIDRWKQELVRRKAELAHKKNTQADRFHTAQAIKQDVLRMEGELRHIEDDIRRGEGELRILGSTMHKGEGLATQDHVEMNKKDLALHKISDEILKLSREIDRLKVEINEKERAKAELKGESQEFVKGKEELRRQYELEHFGANTSFTQAKELGSHLERFKQEFARKEKEIEKNKLEQKEAKQKLMFLQQDVATLEAELRRG